MRKIRILHTADLHLDSPFEGLGASKAALRRGEQRRLLYSIAALAKEKNVDIVLMSGDLLDSEGSYHETGRELLESLRAMAVPVFIAPGNHDYYSPRSPYARLKMPPNVHIFKENRIECVELPELHLRVYGAAYTDSQSGPLLEGFKVDKGWSAVDVLCLHAEIAGEDSPYAPISFEQLENSNLDYAALGHIHKASGLLKAGRTWYSWPGCPEGRGFDECGEKYVSIVELSETGCTLEPVSLAFRRYETLSVDVTGTDALLAIHTALPDDTVRDIYRIELTGECESAPDLSLLHASLAELFFHLQLKDRTRPRSSLWDKAGEDSLRGIFLSMLKEQYEAVTTQEEKARIEQAVRWGLAALDKAEEVVVHEDQ